jgi:hypothetical protein
MYLIILFILEFMILLSWFHTGLITGGGDTGLPLYNPSLTVSLIQYVWWGGQGTGFSYPGVISSLPAYLLLSVFQKIGFTPFLLQVLFFGGTLALSSWGMYALSQKISGSRVIAFFISLFYLINPYSMIHVWHRGSYNGMIMLIVLPWTVYLLYRGLVERRLRYILLLVLISPFFGFVFNTPAFIATWWFVIISLWVYLYSVSTKKKKEMIFYLRTVIAFLFLWLGSNMWWLLPFFHIAPTSLFIGSTQSGNVSSLIAVSEYFTLPFAIRGISTFYPYVQQDWGAIYTNSFFELLSFIEIGFFVFALFFREKIKLFSFFLFLFLVAVFISKGSGSPFGLLMVYAFDLIPFLGVFRNPFEKFGIIIPFAQAFLAGYGLYYATQYSKRIKPMVVYTLMTVLMVGFLAYHWPLFTGNVFGNVHYPAQIQVPEEYDQVRSWFTDQGSSDPRILHLPLALGDGIVYKWQHGYWGLEPSQLFFPGSSISHYIGYPLVDTRYKDLAVAVRNKDDRLFGSLLRTFAINYVVVHNDVDFTIYRNDTLKNILSFVDSSPSLERKTVLGELVIYQVKQTAPEREYLSQIADVARVTGDLSYYPLALEKKGSTTFYTPTEQIGSNITAQHVVLPTAVVNPFAITINPDLLLQELPAVRFLPGSVFYPLIRLKEQLQLVGKDELGSLILQLQFNSKRLVEINNLLGSGKSKQASLTLEEYQHELNHISPLFIQKIQNYIQGYSISELTGLEQVLLRQRELLKRLQTTAPPEILPGLQHATKRLDRLLVSSGIIDIYGITPSLDKRIYRFMITHPGEYQIELGKSWQPFLDSQSAADLLIDGKKKIATIEEADTSISIGPYHFDKGTHEIGFFIDTANMLHSASGSAATTIQAKSDSEDDSSGSATLKTDGRSVSFEYIIDDFQPSFNYLASFEFWTKLGSNPEISFIRDIDPVTKPEINLTESSPETYQFYWRTGATSHTADLFVHAMKMRITLKPWNNCVEMNKKNKSVCKDPGFYGLFSKPSEAVIKNVTLHKFPSNDIYLSDSRSRKESEQQITAHKLNPTKYAVSLNSTGRSVLVLNETYNDGWRLYDENGTAIANRHVLVNGYANGWTLDSMKPGKYTLEFISQRDRKYGIIVGGIFLILGLLLLKYTIWKRAPR